jgi:hypothetical protein
MQDNSKKKQINIIGSGNGISVIGEVARKDKIPNNPFIKTKIIQYYFG